MNVLFWVMIGLVLWGMLGMAYRDVQARTRQAVKLVVRKDESRVARRR